MVDSLVQLIVKEVKSLEAGRQAAANKISVQSKISLTAPIPDVTDCIVRNNDVRKLDQVSK